MIVYVYIFICLDMPAVVLWWLTSYIARHCCWALSCWLEVGFSVGLLWFDFASGARRVCCGTFAAQVYKINAPTLPLLSSFLPVLPFGTSNTHPTPTTDNAQHSQFCACLKKFDENCLFFLSFFFHWFDKPKNQRVVCAFVIHCPVDLLIKINSN